MKPIIFSLAPHSLASSLCDVLHAEAGELNSRSFPDGESYLRIESIVKDRQCIILADMSYPDKKFLPLSFLISTLKELEAANVGLVAPYLSYMRQDRRFVDGEAVTSRIFAQLLSQQFDWLVTVDPHLHRYHSLEEIYTIPSRVVQGAPVLADWLSSEKDVFLVGPDSESEQWVSEIASKSGHPFVIGEKQRHGDRDVKVSLPDLSEYKLKTAVIIDDVISSGQTILECMLTLKAYGISKIKCACVHGIFAEGIDKVLLKSGLEQLLSTNTIAHSSNNLDVTRLLIAPIKECLKLEGGGKL